MCALCGAIITAGALIGLGLTALAFGIRFQGWTTVHDNDQLYGIPSLVLLMVVLLVSVVVGMGVTFMGLMYHHMRRYHEIHAGGHLRGSPEATRSGTL